MKILVLAGGNSTERDVSLVSGTGVYKALKRKGHDVVLADVYMGIDLSDDELENVFSLDRDFSEGIRNIGEVSPDIKDFEVITVFTSAVWHIETIFLEPTEKLIITGVRS